MQPEEFRHFSTAAWKVLPMQSHVHGQPLFLFLTLFDYHASSSKKDRRWRFACCGHQHHCDKFSRSCKELQETPTWATAFSFSLSSITMLAHREKIKGGDLHAVTTNTIVTNSLDLARSSKKHKLKTRGKAPKPQNLWRLQQALQITITR